MGLISGRNCRAFELDLALALRLIKTAALARRAHRRELSERLFRDAEEALPDILSGLDALDPDDQRLFAETTEELRERIQEFRRLLPLAHADRDAETTRRAGSGS